MKLKCEMVEALAGLYLSPRYDEPKATPEFHLECWRRYCSDSLACATAAPRKHAKSTALTHDYGLAVALYREEQYIIIVGSSEDMAIENLNDIANELRENEELRRDFLIKDFVVDQKTDVIVECKDGYQFRFIARGAEQKIRGRKWNGKRPGLIIFDDIEDDEQVESKDRRARFRKWFFRACKQSLREGGKIRGHGTILHQDSLLNHLMKNKSWDSKLYKAHTSFNEFTNILWPDAFSEERLKEIRQEFINEGDSAGYSQEYLNDPRDNDEAYLRREDFIAMSEEDYEVSKIVCVGVDFAISKMDTANRTSFTIGGKDIRNLLHFIDQRTGRWDTSEMIEEFFAINARWSPDMFFVEEGIIWKAVYPILREEMRVRDAWIPVTPLLPTKDKKVRGRSLQKRMRSGGCRFDKQASWYPDFEDELLKFTGDAEATLDDQFDSAAWLSRGFDDHKSDVDVDDFYTEEEIEYLARSKSLKGGGDGRSSVTGY
jgi:predicted phage terminase large subunit-like protein